MACKPLTKNRKSLHLPYATALRMGGLGYNSDAQKDLNVCYNTLDNYVETLSRAIKQPHPGYRVYSLRPGRRLSAAERQPAADRERILQPDTTQTGG